MLGNLVFVAGIVAFIGFSISIPIVVSYFLDRRAHEGVDWFKRRSVLGSGQVAQAKILSSTIVVSTTVGSKYKAAYSIVYELHPPNAPPFRTRGIEVMWFSEARDVAAEGSTVQVRYDPRDQVVVLVRGKRRDRDADRRAKEEALLRGG